MEDALCTFLRIAKIESQKSLAPYKLGCVIVQKRKIISRAHNIYKTDPILGVGYHGYFHAETKAIKNAVRSGYNLSGTTAYVYRENGLLAKPCKNCMLLLKKYGVKKVVFTSSDGLVEYITLGDYNETHPTKEMSAM